MSGALPQREPNVPRAAIIGIGAVMALSIVVAALGRYHHTEAAPGSRPIATRLLGFSDQADGSILVVDQALGTTVAVLPRNQDSFIRATVRNLVRTRHGAGGGAPSPFQLTQWEDGRLTLTDTADNRTLELEAFGPTNWGDFARLLTSEENAR